MPILTISYYRCQNINFENKKSVGKSKNGHSRPHPLVCLSVKEVKAQGEKVGPEQAMWPHRWSVLIRS